MPRSVNGSKYSVHETSEGFEVSGVDRRTVRVLLKRTHFVVEWVAEGDDHLIKHERSLFAFPYLVFAIARGLMRNRDFPGSTFQQQYSRKKWALTQTARAIRPRVYEQWKRLCQIVDPDVLAVQKAVFAATMPRSRFLTNTSLFQNQFVVHDVVRYRAAAVAALFASEMIGSRQLNLARQEVDLGFGLRIDSENRSQIDIDDRRIVDEMMYWPRLYSVTGETYRSLNRTLMKLPGGIPFSLLTKLQSVFLRRPLTQRLELLTVLHSDRFSADKRSWQVFHYADVNQIKDAIQRIAKSTHNQLSSRRSRDVAFAVGFLCDFSEEHKGNIVGLAKKSIRWHRYESQQEAKRVADELGTSTFTQPPPIPLPDDPSITFLESVGDVVEEGQRMGHCVATYCAGAVEGKFYLFHIQHDGEEATVQVGTSGDIWEFAGPNNRRNIACNHGCRILKK